MWRCVVYVCICYVLVLFVSGGWYSSCSDTQSLFTWQLWQYVVSAAAPYPWFHPFGFGWMNLRSWREWLLNEDPPPWLGILANQALWPSVWKEVVWGEDCIFLQRILSFSPLTYTLGFSHGGVRDNLTHYVHLKRELELLIVFDFLPYPWHTIAIYTTTTILEI